MSSLHKRTRCLKLSVNHITSVGTLNHNTRIQMKLEIWRNWARILQMTVQTSSKNLCGLTFVIRRGREGWRELTKNSLEFKHDDQNKEYVTIKHREQTKNNQGGSKQKDQDYMMWECMGYPVRRWIPSHRWNWCSVNFTLIVKPCFRLRWQSSPRRQSAGTKTSS